MFGRSAMVLVTALLMFPQIVETIYSPALTDISRYFSISAAQAAQTLSVYFIGFA
ncbi:MFS transporter, partial [Enterobacter asburiae]